MSKRSHLTQIMLAPAQPFMGMLIGLATFTWGLLVALPTWDAFNKGPQYDFLQSLVSEELWGSLGMLIGAVLIGAFWSGNKERVKYASLAHFYFWGWVCISYLFSESLHLANVPPAFFSLAAGYTYLNIKVRQNRGLDD